MLYCPLCKTSFYCNKEFQKHGCTDIAHIEPEHELDRIILQPGLLHTEMNSWRVFIGLNWEIFAIDVFSTLDYKTENALKYA